MRNCLDKLYIGKTAEGMERQVEACLSREEALAGLYFITFASNGVDQLDIVPAGNLSFRRTREQLPTVVGYGIGQEETIDLVGQIARDAFLATGTCDLQGYLRSVRSGEV